MTMLNLMERFRSLAQQDVPLPAGGQTALRHRRLFEVARESVSLAKLIEAHWDAIAILKEAGREPVPAASYAVWASELPGQPLIWTDGRLSGTKRFCSGLGLVDRALITVRGPAEWLLDIDMQALTPFVSMDHSEWATTAFADTRTGTVLFNEAPVQAETIVGRASFYLGRPGFWHGALGPAACWAGGAAGLLRYAQQSGRDDPHTLAHIGAIAAEVAGMQAILQVAGDAADAGPQDTSEAFKRALTTRHLVESACTRILEHFGRAFGPHPLAMNHATAQRFNEVQLFIRQSHAERDLQELGQQTMAAAK